MHWRCEIMKLILFQNILKFELLLLLLLLFLVGWDWVSRYCGHYWPIVPAPDDRWWWLWRNWLVQSVSRFTWKSVWHSKPPYFNGSVLHKWNRHVLNEEKYEIIGNMIVFYYYKSQTISKLCPGQVANENLNIQALVLLL
jgi:hypothetical protein